MTLVPSTDCSASCAPTSAGLTVSWVLASVAMVMTVAAARPDRAGPWKRSSRAPATPHHHERALRAHERHTLLTLALAILAAVLVRWGLT